MTYYDSISKNIVLVGETAAGVRNNVTLAHEFTHALQDQNFDLSNFMGTAPTSDAYDARNAVVEGDATCLMYDYILSLPEDEFTEYVLSWSISYIDNIPYVLEGMMAFPYSYGTDFVNEIYHNGGWYSVDKLYENPPASTEQIMHPEKYHDNELPLNVSYPAVPGMTLTNEDTIGEFMIKIMLENYIDSTFASDAAEGWGGDHYYYYENENEFLSILTIEWDTRSDASEFNTIYNNFMTYEPQSDAVDENRLRINQDGNNTTIFYSSNPDLIDEIL